MTQAPGEPVADAGAPAPVPPGEALLLVEDDPALVDLLERLLTGQGYAVTPARDVQSGLHAALTRPFAAMVLDRRLPDGDGVELLARLRRQGVATPALVLTAHGTVQDRVEGLDSGADDYLVKPFVAEELLARLRALLRRQLDSAVVLPLGEGALDLEAREALRPDGTRVALSAGEASLLAVLARRPSRVFTREELRDALAPQSTSSSLMDTYVYAVRRKLGRASVRTVRGLGYRAGEIT